VHIDKLVLFDMVTAHGVPKTGIGRALKVLPTWSTRNEHVMVVPSIVDHVSAVIMSHDPRAAYEPTLLCIPVGSRQVLRQVYFAGRHSDAVNTGTLAFMIECLRTDLDIEFHEGKIQTRFSGREAWWNQDIKPVNKLILALGGNKPRMPSQHTQHGMTFHEEIHPSIRIRNYAYNYDDKALYGFHSEWDSNNKTYSWVEDRLTKRLIVSSASASSSESEGDLTIAAPVRVPEYVPSQQEKIISGLNC